LHESVVQTLPSLQFGAGPPVQVPLTHVSLVVHALPSLQPIEPRGVPTQASVASLQVPVAHCVVADEQSLGAPATQAPAALQASFTVQN
jgi:hypothetical protein